MTQEEALEANRDTMELKGRYQSLRTSGATLSAKPLVVILPLIAPNGIKTS